MIASHENYKEPSGKPIQVWFRPGTTDERTLVEVVDKHVYRSKRFGFERYNTAISHSKEKQLKFYMSGEETNYTRNTMFPVRGYVETVYLNKYAGFLTKLKFDGVKLDIEGAEFGLIDNWLLPKTNKLVLEYHTSIDGSPEHLRNRINILRSHFKNVEYPNNLERFMNEPGAAKPFFDRFIFCWEPIP